MKFRIAALLVLGTLAGLVPAVAGPREDVMSGAQRCAGITDNRVWLDCFYGSAQPMRAILGLPPAPVSQQRLVPPAAPAAPVYAAPAYSPPTAYAPPVYNAPAYNAPAPANNARVAAEPAGPPPLPRRRATGFFGTIFGGSKPVTSYQRMASWTRGRNGRFVVTLADGEVWQQDDGDEGDPKWRTPSTRYVVNVYEGALGTYNMNVSDDSTLYKVHRIN